MIKRLFGQYVNKNSIVHRLDSRIKIVIIIILSILLFSAKGRYKIMLLTAIVIFSLLLSKLEFRYIIKSLKPFGIIIVFIAIMYLMFSRNKLNEGLISIWRFIILIILSIILTSTTTIRELIKSIEYFLKPLKIFKLKIKNIALLLSITIRFIPSFFLHAERVKDSFVARRARFKKAGNIRLFTLKLLERMFKSASTLSDAIESRCYDWRLRK